MITGRFPDWRERFASFIETRRHVPLVWGRSDCCLTVADAVLAMTGRDFAERLRGYTTQRGAAVALRQHGFDSVSDYLDAILPRTDHARAGDVVLLKPSRLGPIALADGRGGVWGQGQSGLIRAPMPENALAWRV